MNAPGRSFYLAVGGCIAAMILAAFFVDEDYTLPVAGMFGLVFCGALYRLIWKGILLEAVVLGGLLFGNIVGEWGFGHLHVGRSIYVGEVGMVTCFLIFSIRIAFSKERFMGRDPLSLAICAYVLIGSVRFCVDFFGAWGDWDYEKNVVRDFAAVYYTFFFFITVNIFKHERSGRYLGRVFLVATVFLLPVALAVKIDPEIWEKLSFHEQALVFSRSDLAESFLGFGGIYFMLSREKRGWWFLKTLVGFLSFVFIMCLNSRAPIVGFGLAMLLLMYAGKLGVVRDFVVFGIIGLIALIVINALRPATGDDNLRSLFDDQIASIFDVGSAGKYETDYGVSKAGNNHYRTEWWRAVNSETMENNPLFGLGFGYDLAARFIRTYDLPLDPEDFTARSPHSILVSTFGRVGFVGLASFLFVIFLMFRGAWRCAAAVRRKQVPAIDLAAWCGVIIIFVASCFSVMLEGPMAAIVFWSLLGMASYRQILTTEASKQSASPKPLLRPSPSRPPLVAAGYR